MEIDQKKLTGMVKGALRRYSKGRLTKEDIDDASQEILLKVLSGKAKSIPAYIDRAAKNRTINLLAIKKRHGEVRFEDESIEIKRNESKESNEEPENKHFKIVWKAVEIIDLLYRVSLTRDNPNITQFLCIERSINILSNAKKQIDNLMDDLPPLDSENLIPEKTGIWKYAKNNGTGISRCLQDEIHALFLRRESLEALPKLLRIPDFVMDSLPKMKADPVMLLLRVLYKYFKVGSGRRRVHETISKMILEMKSQDPKNEVLKSITQKTNFETLRKKIYRKSTDPFYDRIAEWIYKEIMPRDN